jgi:hypothetical protein
MDYQAIAALIINQAVKDGKGQIFQRDLTHSEIPNKRDGKRKPRPHRVRGESFTKNPIRAIYQTPEQAEMGWLRMPQESKAPWDGVTQPRPTEPKRNFGRAH